jgi:hypothetical protein
MKDMFLIEFEYHQQQYYGIVRIRQKEQGMELKVRIMNARIDKLFYGHHIFKVEDNHIVEEKVNAGKATLLRSLVQHSIEQHLKEPLHRA